MTNARDKANIPVLNFQSKGIDDNADATAITIDSSENVGIKNTTPSNFNASARQLVVGSGSGDNGITIFAGTSNNSSLFLADGTTSTNGYRGSINYLHNGDALTLHANATETMRLTNGNVSIGTTVANSRLNIFDSSNSQMNFYTSGTGTGNGDGFRVGFNGSQAQLYLFEDADFRIATNNSEKFRIKSDGKIGISTTNPQEQLDISSNSPRIRFSDTSVTDLHHKIGSEANDLEISCDAGNDQASSHIGFKIDGSEKVRITDAGLVGIGISSPGSPLTVSGGTNSTVATFNNDVSATTDVQNVLLLQSNTTGTAGVGFGLGIAFNGERNDGNVQRFGEIGFEASLNSGTSLNTDFFIKRYLGTEVFRVTHGGRIVRNATSTASGHGNFVGEVGSSSKALAFEHTNGGGVVGSVTTGSSSVAYNTSSDYRLKENVVEITDATTRLKQLKPKRFNFIADADTTVDGFIAHEVSSVVPEAITGNKDAVDEDGKPIYQGIDQSKLVPLLVKTIQELEARITTLEANNP